MFKAMFNALFGTKAERDIKKIQPLVDRINQLEPELKQLSDEQLQAKTGEFRTRLREQLGCDPVELPLQGEENKRNVQLLRDTLDALLPEAFAVVRETAWRTIRQRPYDVQLIGGIVLHQGKIAEMKTGEGKTLTSTMPVYLNALTGLGVHVVTVNDYLAQRDAEWMEPIFRFLGVSVGYIISEMDPESRQKSYAADITYGTNNEFGFDYLRDNMAVQKELRVQRNYYFSIVDEVDSILIDEARTPLIISGAADDSTSKYKDIQRVIPRLKRGMTVKQHLDQQLKSLTDRKTEINTKLENKSGGEKDKLEQELNDIKAELKRVNREKQQATINKELNEPLEEGDYIIEEEDRSAFLTPNGIKTVEDLLRVDNLYSAKNIELVHHVEQALKANTLFNKDVDYVVKDGEVIIVDEFTGRLMPGRRYNDGLHQALEAKERVHVARENQTLASITFQNFFRMYTKLSGMTGTADTEAEEFNKIYKLDVVVIPTNKPIIRLDHPDKIYRTENEKVQGIVRELEELHKKGQPVLVGTISVEKSEKISRSLKKRGVPHNVLNAKHHDMEAEIVAQAGQPHKVTIATNMAGRGTDIVLGGNPEFQGRQLVENLLKNKHVHGTHEEIQEFVRLVLLNDEAAYKQYIAEHDQFDMDMVSRILKVQAQCKESQKQVLEAGGLHILGTERHEARRIDNQLRGRAGRQGDPGSSRFYISMEDDLMRLFGGERLMSLMQRMGMKEGEEIEHKMISRAIANAQRKVEARNFDIRKHLLKYDEVMNEQRTYVYDLRNKVLNADDHSKLVQEMIDEVVAEMMDIATGNSRSLSDESILEVQHFMESELHIRIDFDEFGDLNEINIDTFEENLVKGLRDIYKMREQEIGSRNMRILEKMVILNTIDNKWKDHLYEMDYLKEGITWRSYAERDPLVEYKHEGAKMFQLMLQSINSEALSLLYNAEITGPLEEEEQGFDDYFIGDAMHDEYGQFGMLTPEEQQQIEEQGGAMGHAQPGPRRQLKRTGEKVGRNAPCPCGSGKKYKHCCYPKYG